MTARKKTVKSRGAKQDKGVGRFSTAGDIKVGVIGYGGAFNMGKGHLEQMQAAGMTPVAVAEIDPERLEVAAGEFPGIETYDDVGKMLKASDVNVVTIITPHNTHAKLAVQCLRAGRHVVVEKPFAIRTGECDKMIEAAAKRDLMVTTYHNRHWDGVILEAVEQIGRKGVIGEVVRVEAHMGQFGHPGDWWRTSKSVSGGIMYDWGVHLLEYALQLVDGEITEVMGVAKRGVWGPATKWGDDANEDEGYALVRMSSGQWVTLMITKLDSNPKKGQLEITGTKGSYVCDQQTWEVIQEKDGQKIVRSGRNRPGEQSKFYKNVAAHLVKGEALVITPEWARRPIHVLDLADRSAREGRALRAKYG